MSIQKSEVFELDSEAPGTSQEVPVFRNDSTTLRESSFDRRNCCELNDRSVALFFTLNVQIVH
jgi:hypothetical protein